MTENELKLAECLFYSMADWPDDRRERAYKTFKDVYGVEINGYKVKLLKRDELKQGENQ